MDDRIIIENLQSFELSLFDTLDAVQIEFPDMTQTAIELPYRLILSTFQTCNFLLGAEPVAASYETLPVYIDLDSSRAPSSLDLAATKVHELWHARLVQGATSRRPIPSVKAIYNSDRISGIPAQPFKMSLDAEMRCSIVEQTVSVESDDPGLGAIAASTLALSSAGGFLDVAWKRPGDLPSPSECGPAAVAKYVHQIAVGRDHFAQTDAIVYPKFGHKCAITIKTWRYVDKRGVARLQRTKNITVLETSKEFGFYDSLGLGFSRIILKTPEADSTTSAPVDIVDIPVKGVPAYHFIRPVYEGTTREYKFVLEFLDHGGNTHHIEQVPLAFVSEDLAATVENDVLTGSYIDHDMVPQSGFTYPSMRRWARERFDRPPRDPTLDAVNAADPYPTVPFPGQPCTLAPSATSPAFTATTGVITVQPDELAPADGPTVTLPSAINFQFRFKTIDGGLSFRPRLDTAIVTIPSLRRLMPTASIKDLETTISFFNDYLISGFAENAKELWAQCVAPLALDMSGRVDVGKSYLADMRGSVAGLSRSIGVVAGQAASDALRLLQDQGKVDLSSFFSLDNAPKLFGIFELKRLFSTLPTDFKTLVNSPRLKTQLTPDCKAVETTYAISTPLRSYSVANVVTLEDGATLSFTATLTAPIDGGHATQIVRCSIDNSVLSLRVGGSQPLLSATIGNVTFLYTSEGGAHVTVSEPHLNPSGALAFLTAFLSKFAGGNGPYLRAGRTEVIAGYRIVTGAALGAVSISDLNLAGEIGVPISSDAKFTTSLALGSSAQPFNVIVAFLGGAGFFSVTWADELLLAGGFWVEARAEIGFAGIASGEVHARAGLFYGPPDDRAPKCDGQGDEGYQLAGNFNCGGHLCVLSIISADCGFDAIVAYLFNCHEIYVHAEYYFSYHVLFFGIDIKIPLDWTFSMQGADSVAGLVARGSNSIQSAAQITNDHFASEEVWQKYCDAFA